MGAGLGVGVLRLDGCNGVEAGWLGGRVTNRCRQTAGRFPAAGAMRCLPLASSAVLKPAAHMPCPAGTGWPSFFDALPNAVVLEKDNSIPFMPRTEVGGWVGGCLVGPLACWHCQQYRGGVGCVQICRNCALNRPQCRQQPPHRATLEPWLRGCSFFHHPRRCAARNAWATWAMSSMTAPLPPACATA